MEIEVNLQHVQPLFRKLEGMRPGREDGSESWRGKWKESPDVK